MEPIAWKHLNGRQIDALDRERTILWVPVSPLEVHGPHLPTVTDSLEATALGRASMAHLAERHPDMVHVELPPIWVAADVLPHPGSVAFRASTVARVLTDLGRSLARQGFRHIWLTNFHGGPRHFVAMEVAADRVNKRFGARMVSVFSLLLTRLTGGASDLSEILGDALPGIPKEALQGDSHGGALETSLLLHLLGQHVDPGFADLPRRTVDTVLAERGQPPLPGPGQRPPFRELLRTFKEKLKYYEDETYAGHPALASPEAGAIVLDRLGALSAEALSELWTGAIGPEDCRSPLWRARWLFMAGLPGWLFERAVRYKTRVW